MNKTDKLLYGGFGVVIIGGIVAMLVSVFSPPKQLAEEETAEPPPTEPATTETASALEEITPPEGAVAYYLDDDGNKVWLTAEDIAASDALEAEAKAEKEWWASRQDWIDRFPFQPTHHPEITYDLEVYDPSRVREWPEEKKDDAYWKMHEMVNNHGFLRKFYKSRLPYTEEFEQMHDIVTEEVGEFDSVFDLGWAFNSLKKYHQAMAQAPDAIYRKNAQVYQPQPPPQPPPSILDGLTPQQLAAYKALPGMERRSMTAKLREERAQEMRKRIKAIQASQRYQTVDITWQDQAEQEKDGIIGALLMDHRTRQPLMSKELATRIRDRLLNEIPADGFLKMGKENLCYVHHYQRELKAGDPLLIK